MPTDAANDRRPYARGLRRTIALIAVGVVTPATVALPTRAALAASPIAVTRVAGADRYATAAAIADAGWPSQLPPGSTLLVASGETFPDAIAGAAAAGHLGVPLLLTAQASLPAVTSAEISRLKPATVAVLGGTAAVGDAVFTQLRALAPTVTRWQGSDRFATAATVSSVIYPGGTTNVYLASGLAFPDGVAGAALAATAGGPLLLTDPTSLPPDTAAEIARLHPSAIVVFGGTAAVSDSVAAAAVSAAGGAQLSRIDGPDRYQTADAVAAVLAQSAGNATASAGIFVASGLNFPDALAGSAWAGATHRPLLLVPQTYVTPPTWQEIQTLAPPAATVLGGTASVSTQLYDGIASGNPPTSPPIPAGNGATDWPTYHHDGARSGATTGTPVFTAFASAWKAALDGAVYGQPIVVGSTVVAATEGGSLYGLSVTSGAVLWRAHIADPIRLSSLPCGDIDPLGITSTPAYDATTGLVLALGETAGGHHILAGVNIATGGVAFSRTLDPLVGDPLATQQRSALLVANGRVYVGFGGLAGDCANYIGQVVSVASDGSGTPIGWAVPTSREGGIWATAGPVLNSDGTIFVAVGNGASDTAYDGSDSVTRLSATLSRLDYFAPSVWANDNDNDLDLGSMSPVIVDGKVLAAGKRGVAYLLDPAHLGGIGGQLSSVTVCRPFGGAAVSGQTAFLPCTDGIRSVTVSGNSMTVGWHAASDLKGPPVYASGTLYTTDGSGSVYAIDPATGVTRAHIGVGSLPTFASPSLSGDYVLIGTTTGVTAVTVG
jgi:polyvinyl alcohol dehydrogenase (cytochrome)